MFRVLYPHSNEKVELCGTGCCSWLRQVTREGYCRGILPTLIGHCPESSGPRVLGRIFPPLRRGLDIQLSREVERYLVGQLIKNAGAVAHRAKLCLREAGAGA
jgi:hypothetical protein